MLAANVVIEDGDATLAAAAENEARAWPAERRLRERFVSFGELLKLHDDDDPDDGPLYAVGAMIDGCGVIVAAPGTDDVGELERRVVRCLSIDATIDDYWRVR